MSNETKRDVLVNAVDALADAQASSDNNVGLGHQDADLFMAEYEKALPDNLPVIPKAVGASIKEQKAKQSLGGALFDAIFAANELGRKKVGPVVNWMVDNDETYASAWLTGVWRVDETGEVVKLEEKNETRD